MVQMASLLLRLADGYRVLLVSLLIMVLRLVVLMMMLMVVVVDCRNIAAAGAASAATTAGVARGLYLTVNVVVFVRVARVTAGSGTVGQMVAHVVSIVVLGSEQAMIVMHILMDGDVYSRVVWHIVHFIRGP